MSNQKNFQQNYQDQARSNISKIQNNPDQQWQNQRNIVQNQQNQTNQQQISIQSNQQRIQQFIRNDNQQQQNITFQNQMQNQKDQCDIQNDQQGEKNKKIKLLKARPINEIMIYLENQRDSYIEPQYRTYLQQDCSIQELIKEYVPKQYQMLEFDELTQELDGYIKVRGDGNCFYNTFIYQYLVNVLNKSHEDYEVWIQKFKYVKFIIQLKTSNPYTSEDYKAMKDYFFQQMNQIYQIDTKLRVKSFQERYSINKDYLYQLSIIFCRSVISTCLMNRKQQDEEKAAFYDLALQEVGIWEEDCNYNELVLDCINSVLRISIKLFIFEKDLFRIMNYSFDNYPQIYILFRQGHYVIPKIKQQEITNASIVYYQKKLQAYQGSKQKEQEAEDFNNLLKAELNDSISQANSYKKQLENANKQIQDLNTQINNLEYKQQEVAKLNRFLQTKQENSENIIKEQQNTINNIQQENYNLKINFQRQSQSIDNQKQEQTQQQQFIMKLQQELEKLKFELKQQAQIQNKFTQQTQMQYNQIIPQPTIPIKIQFQENQIQNQNQDSQFSQQNNQQSQMQFQVQAQSSQSQTQYIRIISLKNLNQEIHDLLSPPYGVQDFYEIVNFQIALVVGYLQNFSDYSHFYQSFQYIKYYSNSREVLTEQLKSLNFQDLSNINEKFSNLFIEYIANYDVEKNLEKFTQSINIQLQLFNEQKRRIFNRNYQNVVRIVCFRQMYYLNKLK